jgi:hypothetical protein
MFIVITKSLDASPDSVQRPGSTTLKFSARSTGVAFDVEVQYSIAEHWKVAFEENGARTKHVSLSSRLAAEAREVTRQVRLVRDPDGAEEPESVRITAVVRRVDPEHSQRTSTEVGIQ